MLHSNDIATVFLLSHVSHCLGSHIVSYLKELAWLKYAFRYTSEKVIF